MSTPGAATPWRVLKPSVSEEEKESEISQAIKKIEENDVEYEDTPLGQGTYGIVWKGTLKSTVAIKKYTFSGEGIPQEALTLGSVRTHENITSLYGVVQYQHTIGIVMEFAPDGSLYDYLHKKGLKPSLEQSVEWAMQVARGMKHLHDNNIVHRDLKSPNILLSGNVAKICDFGTARFLKQTAAQTGVTGTYRWMAPEVMKCEDARINRRCDTYSYAVVLYELFEGKVPFHEIQTEPIFVKIYTAVVEKGQRPQITVSGPPYILGLIKICWREDPNMRLEFEQVIQALKTEDVSEWEHEYTIIAISDLHFGVVRGRGGEGAVYEGKWEKRDVAIKKYISVDIPYITKLQSLGQHPNIVSFYGCARERVSVFIVSELMKGGSIFRILHQDKEVPSFEQRVQWMKDIAEGVVFLHSKNVIHGDLKSANVLISDDDRKTAKLNDFGMDLSRFQGQSIRQIEGTLRWMAPEVMQGVAKIGKEVDAYSYSMILCELITLQLPFKDTSTELMAAMSVQKGERPILPPSDSECPPYLRRLITTCWDKDPQKRPSFENIKSSLSSEKFP